MRALIKSFGRWPGFVLVATFPLLLLGVSNDALAQASHASGGSSGGGQASSGGGSHASSGGGGGGSHASAGGGGGGSRAASGGSGGHAMAGGGPHASGASSGRSTASGAVTRSASGAVGAAPTYSKPRGNQPAIGTAVPRTPSNSPAPPIVPGGAGFYPWGLGFFGAYGAYGLCGYGYYECYDPWYGGGVGGDWDMGGGGGYSSSSSQSEDEGAVHLKVTPREALVYVDGYYVGIVDDFDGLFQKLHLEAGPHRVEIRAPGYETLTFDLAIAPNKTITYRGELKKLP
jgi:hypothetical protein